MTWNANVWPASDNVWVYISNYNDLVSAINERDAETYEGGPYSTKSAGDWIHIGDIVDLRAAVENMITYFYNPTTGDAWTKADVLNEAIGQADWTDAGLAADAEFVHPVHYQELKDVIAELVWLSVTPTVNVQEIYAGNSGWLTQTWAACWSSAKSIAAGIGWVTRTPPSFYAGIYNNYHGVNAGGAVRANLYHSRIKEMTCAVPNYGVDILSSKFRIQRYWNISGGPTATDHDMYLYDAKDYGGNAHGFTIDSADTNLENMLITLTNAATKNADNKFSVRSQTATPDPDDYEPSTAPAAGSYTYARFRPQYPEYLLLNELDWDYT